MIWRVEDITQETSIRRQSSHDMHHIPNRLGIDTLKPPHRDKIVTQVGKMCTSASEFYMKIINNKHTLLYNRQTIHSVQRYNGLCELTNYCFLRSRTTELSNVNWDSVLAFNNFDNMVSNLYAILQNVGSLTVRSS